MNAICFFLLGKEKYQSLHIAPYQKMEQDHLCHHRNILAAMSTLNAANGKPLEALCQFSTTSRVVGLSGTVLSGSIYLKITQKQELCC